MKSSIILIANPVALRTSERKVAMASYYLQSKGHEVAVLFTQRKGDAEMLAREAISRRPSCIIAAGGDGTFNEVANGLAGTDIPMAILPLGTTNVLAREIGVPSDLEGAIETVLRKQPRPISLGRITLTTPPPRSRFFILMAGIGYDALAVRGTIERLKKYSGQGAYILSGLKTLMRFEPAPLTFIVEGQSHEGYSGIIGNGAKYGGRFSVTPDARLTDPILYACIFKGHRRRDIVRYAVGILTGSHRKYKDIDYVRGTKITVIGHAHIQLDGDYFGTTPAEIEVVPGALKLIF